MLQRKRYALMHDILVVDDDDAVRATIVDQLARIEAKVVDVSDARRAIELVTSRKFDLIISDLFMPEVDGIKFISEARRINPSTPIILISGGGARFPLGGQDFDNLAETARILGASQVLKKPFRGGQLREMVASFLTPS